MSFVEENNDNRENKPPLFFGFELGNGVVYVVVAILALIFVRQMAGVLQALN
ncbi:MAG: hypothetical protein HQ498_11230 [Pseudohongiella sp.]|jgi:hypothetical protein|nr:hypothetical protein [Pseudohongiella sp.]